MLKIGFLVSKTVENSHPASELDILRVRFEVVYSWEELEKFSNRTYSRAAFNFVKMLAQNHALLTAIRDFRKKFNLPEEGVDFVKKQDIIRNTQRGQGHPMWCYENLLPEVRRPEAQKYIADFIETHTIHAPLKYQMNSLFYCGFVDTRINDIWVPLGIHIPIQQDIEQRAWGYRIPVSICLNSANLTN